MRTCMRFAPSTAKSMYWSARESSCPPVAPLEELGEAGDLAQRLLEVVRGYVRELLQLRVGALEVRGLRVQPRPRLLLEGQFADETPAHGVDLAAEPSQIRRS